MTMASLSGLMATPLLTPYSMTKHALVGASRPTSPRELLVEEVKRVLGLGVRDGDVSC